MSTTHDTSVIGVVCTLVYVSLSSGRDLFFAGILHQVSIFVMVLIAFTVTMAMFSIPQLARMRELPGKVRAKWGDLTRINITTAVMWLSFIFALKHMEPAVVVAVNSAVIPVTTLGIAVLTVTGHRVAASDALSAAGIFVSVAFLAVLTATGASAVGELSTVSAILGISGAIVSGAATAWNNVIAKRLADRGLAAADIMAFRFPLLIAACAVCIWLFDVPVTVTSGQLTAIAAASLLVIMLPLYFLQLGIARSDMATTGILIAIGPLVTFGLQQALGRYPFSLPSFVGILVALAFVLYALHAKFRSAEPAVHVTEVKA
jgi:drug/metabolite transporter (DMT)-like permease